MPWNEIHIATSADYANELGDKLTAFGAHAVTFQDAGNQPIYEPDPNALSFWQETIVIGLFEMEQELQSILKFLESECAQGQIKSFHLNHLADENWERKCLLHFKPMRFGNRLWICPSWHTPPEKNAVNVMLDPGLAFGTGTHPTTTLCLKWLDEQIQGGETVIDYGCGSGILAIAALKLGAKKVIAIDRDPQALVATRLNADRNAIPPSALTIHSPEGFTPPSVDILIANILAKPLIDLAETFSKLIKPTGKIGLSGILSNQINEIRSAYARTFTFHEPRFMAEWVLLDGIKT